MNEVNEKKVCEPANTQYYKASDAKGLGADAKIIMALLKQQPLKRIELCEKANINESTFSRYKRLLLNKGILKESTQGFSLWYYEESSSLWDIMLGELQKAGGHLTKVKLEKFVMTKRDSARGSYNLYDDPVTIEGVIILRGAAKLEDALRLGTPNEYRFEVTHNLSSGGFLVTTVSVKSGDRFIWQSEIYQVGCTYQFFDGLTLSYTIAKLTKPPLPY
jgi:hypothetical protein